METQLHCQFLQKPSIILVVLVGDYSIGALHLADRNISVEWQHQ